MKEKYFDFISKTVAFLSGVALLTFSLTSIYEVWIKYQSNDTSIKISTRISEDLPMPTITLCFLPLAKKHVLDEYNVTLSQYRYEYSEGIMEGLPWIKIYNKAAYNIGKDFNISLALDNYNQFLTLNNVNLTQELANHIHLKIVPTLWMGVCYQMDYKSATKANWEWKIVLHFNESIQEKDLPKVYAVFTSNDNGYGILNDNWVDGEKYSLLINPLEMMEYSIEFKTSEYQSLKGMRHCGEETFYKCVADR